MAFSPFHKIKVPPGVEVTAKNINGLQENIASAFQQILGKDFLDATILTNITLNPGVMNKVPHKLGRRLVGFIPVLTNGTYAILTDHQDENTTPDLLLYLTTPVLIKVNLLVF